MIRLARITIREIHLPLSGPFETSAGVVENRRILLLELVDTDGTGAWSECVAEALPTYAPDTVDTCWLALSEWIAPLVLGQALSSPRAADMALEQGIRGHRMARASVEMGIWALAATQNEMSLASLLASESRSERMIGVAPRPFVETGIALGMQSSPHALAGRAAAAEAEGYRRIKMKIAPSRDADYVRAAREAVGKGVALTVDANGSYSLNRDKDLQALKELDTLGLSMIEQPLAHDDLVHHAELQRSLSTPVCLDESIDGEAATETMIALGSARIVNLKPGRVGGFTQALAIHDRCADAGIPMWCGGMLESGIGRAYNVALASLPNFQYPGDLSPSARYWARDVVVEPWTMDLSGKVKVPLDRAGAGVDADKDLIDNLTVRTATFTA